MQRYRSLSDVGALWRAEWADFCAQFGQQQRELRGSPFVKWCGTILDHTLPVVAEKCAPQLIFPESAPDLFLDYAKEITREGMLPIPFDVMWLRMRAPEQDWIALIDARTTNAGHAVFQLIVGSEAPSTYGFALLGAACVQGGDGDYWNVAQFGKIDVSVFAGAVISHLASLDCREFVETKSEAPAKLNAARVKRGKAPLETQYVIQLRAEVRKRLEPSVERTADGEKRKSPEGHWRQGHIKRQRDAAGNVVRKVKIPMHTVMGGPGGDQPLFKPRVAPPIERMRAAIEQLQQKKTGTEP